jgi:hypothetical protein
VGSAAAKRPAAAAKVNVGRTVATRAPPIGLASDGALTLSVEPSGFAVVDVAAALGDVGAFGP